MVAQPSDLSASPVFAVPLSPAPEGLPEGRADGHEHDSGDEDDDQPADVVAGTHVRRSRQPRVRHYANEESDDPGDDAGAEAREPRRTTIAVATAPMAKPRHAPPSWENASD